MFQKIANFARGAALVGALGGAAAAQTPGTSTTPSTGTTAAPQPDNKIENALSKAQKNVSELLKRFGIDTEKAAEKKAEPTKPVVTEKKEPKAEVVVQDVTTANHRLNSKKDFETAKVNTLLSIAGYEDSVKGFKRALPLMTDDAERSQLWKDLSHIAGIKLVEIALAQDFISKELDRRENFIKLFGSSAFVGDIFVPRPGSEAMVKSHQEFSAATKGDIAKDFDKLLKYLGNNTAFTPEVIGAYVVHYLNHSNGLQGRAAEILKALKINPKTMASSEDEFVAKMIELSQSAAPQVAPGGIVPGQTVIAKPNDPKDENTTLKTLQTVAVYAVPVAAIWGALRYFRH